MSGRWNKTWQEKMHVAPENLYAEATWTSLPGLMEKKEKPWVVTHFDFSDLNFLLTPKPIRDIMYA